MDNKEFAQNLEKRTLKFAISVIKLSSSLPSNPEARVIKNQITKSGTSIGANYREANRARSKADFYNKIKICQAEASETGYWLEIIKSLGWEDLAKVELKRKECDELIAIFTSIVNNLKDSAK